jgi:GGDEF domain-containing protein
MENESKHPARGLILTPEQKAELGLFANELTNQFLDHPYLEGMDPADKEATGEFIGTAFEVLTDNNCVTNNKTVAEIAIATAPDLERRRQKEAFTDSVTGLSNGDAFLVARPRIDEDPNSNLIYLDLIGLGDLNNNESYDEGTNTLIAAAQAIQDEASKLDIDDRDIFRFGGDEFGVRVPKEHAHYLLYRILNNFGERVVGKTVTGLRGAYGETFEEADQKMQELKEAGRRNWASKQIARIMGNHKQLVTHLDNQ